MTSKAETKPAEILPGEVIRHVPLSDIFVDYDWNVRSKIEVMSDVSDAVQDTTVKGEHLGEGTGIRGLALDLHMTGQDTPVVLRAVEDGKSLGGKKTDKPFEAVCGFRRITAAELVNAGKAEGFGGKADNKESKELADSIAVAKKAKKPVIPNTADGTVLAVIRKLTAREARILNGKENTNRANLTTPDMVRYIAILQTAEKMNQTQIADALGIGQPHVSRLARVATLPKQIVSHWAGQAKLPGLPESVSERLTSRQLVELADNTKGQTEGEIVARYVEMLNPPTPAEGTESGADPVAKRIKDVAVLLAGLIRNGVIASDSLHWSRVIGPKKEGFIIDTGKADAAQRGLYWDMMEAEFTKALDGDKPAKPGKGKGGEKDGEAPSAN